VLHQHRLLIIEGLKDILSTVTTIGQCSYPTHSMKDSSEGGSDSLGELF
jgi:hypothetical protein